MPGLLIAFEGLDQSGKETQARRLADRLREDGHRCRTASFPDYDTPIGQELRRALAGEREYGADVMQLLYVANRYERKPDLERWLAAGEIVLCDRYAASSIAYGAAQALDAGLARRDPAVPSAGRGDAAARHPSRDRGGAQGERAGPLRARSRAARPRP